MEPTEVRDERRRRLRAADDVTLVAAMRAGDVWAATEFRARMLAFAARVKLSRDEVDECIEDLIEDVAMKLVGDGIAPPHDLTSYFIRALRRRLALAARAHGRREQRYRAASVLLDGSAVVESTCSEWSLRVREPRLNDPDHRYGRDADDVDATAAARARLVSTLVASMTTDEQELIGWVGQAVGYGIIAEWLGITYAAAAKRIARLRARLRRVVEQHVHAAKPRERA